MLAEVCDALRSLMAGAGKVTALGRRLEHKSLHLPFLSYTSFPCPCPTTPLPARPLEQNPASTAQFLLEQIVAGIVGYLNPHIISSSVLH